MRRKKNRHPLGAEACSNIHSFIYESQICDSAKVSISVLHANIFYCYIFIKIQRQCSLALPLLWTPRGRRQPLMVKSYHLIEPPYCIYKMKQNLHNSAKYKTFPYLGFSLLCGANFDTKLHQERKLCFHDREIMALLPLRWNDVKQAVAPMEVRPSA